LNEEQYTHIDLYNISSDIISSIFPNFYEFDFKLNLGDELIKRLELCKPDAKEWNVYEELCIDIIQFLFISEFDYIFYQKKSEDV